MPVAFYFQGVDKKTSGMKWANFNYVFTHRKFIFTMQVSFLLKGTKKSVKKLQAELDEIKSKVGYFLIESLLTSLGLLK